MRVDTLENRSEDHLDEKYEDYSGGMRWDVEAAFDLVIDVSGNGFYEHSMHVGDMRVVHVRLFNRSTQNGVLLVITRDPSALLCSDGYITAVHTYQPLKQVVEHQHVYHDGPFVLNEVVLEGSELVFRFRNSFSDPQRLELCATINGLK